MRRPDLTEREVRKLVKVPGVHWVSRGLYLDTTSGASWAYRYMLDGVSHYMGLGGFDTYTLGEARERARIARKLAKDGIDPIQERKGRRAAVRLKRAKAMTFRESAEHYIRANAAGWANAKHARQWPSTLATYAYPVIGDLPVQAVDTTLVMRVLEPLWSEKTETAARLRGRIEAVLAWATTRGYRRDENPARWRGHLETLLPKKSKVRRVKHHAALDYREIGSFMVELRQQEGIAARALEFAILTACRTGEVLGARWDEINLADRMWIVPPSRMKADREHRVPLSEPAIAILEQMQAIGEGDFVFPGGRAGRPPSPVAMLSVLKKMGRGEVVTHGFRSCFADWCTECTGFPAEAREMALAHAVGGKVEAAYRRGDLFQKRRDVMAAWAEFCGPPQSGNVVALRAAAQ